MSLFYKRTKKLIRNPKRFFADSRYAWIGYSVYATNHIAKKFVLNRLGMATFRDNFSESQKLKNSAKEIWALFTSNNQANASKLFEDFIIANCRNPSAYNNYTMQCLGKYIYYCDHEYSLIRAVNLLELIRPQIEQHDWSLGLLTYFLIKVRQFEQAEAMLARAITHEVSGNSLKLGRLDTCLGLLIYLDYELNKFGKKVNDKPIYEVQTYITSRIKKLRKKKFKALKKIIRKIATLNMNIGHNPELLEFLKYSLDNLYYSKSDKYELAQILTNVPLRFQNNSKECIDFGLELLDQVDQALTARQHITLQEIQMLVNTKTKMDKLNEVNEFIDTYYKKYLDAYNKKASFRTIRDLQFIFSVKNVHYSFKNLEALHTEVEFQKFLTKKHLRNRLYRLGASLVYIPNNLISYGEYDQAYQLIRELEQYTDHHSLSRKIYELSVKTGDFDTAIQSIEDNIDKFMNKRNFIELSGESIKKLDTYLNQRDRSVFMKETAEILNSAPQPKNPKGVLFVNLLNCLNSLAMETMLMLSLKKQGYAVTSLTEGFVPNDKTGIESIDKFMNFMAFGSKNIAKLPPNIHLLINDWQIDWDNREVISGGINYYQPIYEVLCVKIRKCTIDINNYIEGKIFNQFLVIMDKAVHLCNLMYAEFKELSMPVRFISANGHLTPVAVFRKFCQAHGEEIDMHFINANPAYQNYYTNLGIRYSTAIGISDTTQFPDLRSPFLARREQFDEWMAKGNTYEKYKTEIDEWLNKNRVNTDKTEPEAVALLERIKSERASGKKVICMFGKIPFDMAVPYDGGPAHRDMTDWINHSIECARESDNLFIIKPHPHELRTEIARIANEKLIDLIHVDLPDNVIFMGNNWFNNQELIPHLDLGVLWNGTSSLELGARNVPVVMCGHFGKHDYPVDLIYPKDREDYKNILCSKKPYNLPKDYWEKCALLLKYMSTDEIAVPLEYNRRPATNDPIGVPVWFHDQVEKYFKEGDKYVEELANRVFEYSRKASKSKKKAA